MIAPAPGDFGETRIAHEPQPPLQSDAPQLPQPLKPQQGPPKAVGMTGATMAMGAGATGCA